MADLDWNRDSFCSGLTTALTATLREFNTASLAVAVAGCAAAAEAVCEDRPMACSAGCPHCCVLNVAVLLPEALVIADWLQGQLHPVALAALRQRLAVHRNWGRWMDDEERIVRKAVCPLLNEVGSCSIHPVRPLACRSVSSLDRLSCEEAFDPIIGDQERGVPADLMRRAVYDAAFMALASVLGCHGLDDRSIELGTGVLAFLESPACRDLLLSRKRLPRQLWE